MKNIRKNFDELRRQAEDLVKERGENRDDAPFRMDIIELVEELRIHQAELEIQNQNLRIGQKEISRLHREYEDLFEFAPCCYLVVGLKGNIIRCNQTGITFLGVQHGKLFNRVFSSFIAEESLAVYFAALKELKKNGLVKALDLKLHRDDDSFLWVRADMHAHPGLDNRIMQWRFSLINIDEQKKAEAELVFREKKYHAMMEQCLDMIFLHDLKGNLLEVNREAIRCTGYSRDELLAMNIFDLYPDKNKSKSETMDRWSRWRPGESTLLEMNQVGRSGLEYPVEIHGGKVNFDGGDHILAMVRDLSERKQTYDALQASLEDKAVLLNEVHHRVKNNLGIITALLEMELQNVHDPAAAATLKDLETRIRSIALVHELLYQKGNPAQIDFQAYLDSLLQDLRFSGGANKNIRCIGRAEGIRFGIDMAIPCGMIINELVTNAIKYAFPAGKTNDGHGRPEIRVEVSKQDDHYRMVVADNGIGFPEDLDLDNSRSFGLRLVKMIGAHQLQGKFEVERDNGTRITLIFKDTHAQFK